MSVVVACELAIRPPLPQRTLRLMVTDDRLMTMKRKDRVVPAGEVEAKCLSLSDDVEKGNRSFMVTRRGRPVARVVPIATGQATSLVGSLLDEGDLLAPVDVDWEASW